MAFIITKKSKGHGQVRKLYYLVENYREGKKVKRKKLLALGLYNTVSQLLEATKQEETHLINALKQCEEKLTEYLATGKYPHPYPSDRSWQVDRRMKKFVEQAQIDLKMCQEKIIEIQKYM